MERVWVILHILHFACLPEWLMVVKLVVKQKFTMNSNKSILFSRPSLKNNLKVVILKSFRIWKSLAKKFLNEFLLVLVCLVFHFFRFLLNLKVLFSWFETWFFVNFFPLWLSVLGCCFNWFLFLKSNISSKFSCSSVFLQLYEKL